MGSIKEQLFKYIEDQKSTNRNIFTLYHCKNWSFEFIMTNKGNKKMYHLICYPNKKTKNTIIFKNFGWNEGTWVFINEGRQEFKWYFKNIVNDDPVEKSSASFPNNKDLKNVESILNDYLNNGKSLKNLDDAKIKVPSKTTIDEIVNKLN